jgi:hypothetical protein
MKKVIIITVLFAVVLLNPVPSAGAEINIFGGVGFAFSDVEGVLIELGAEMRLTKGFYMQLMVDTYLDDRARSSYYYLGDGYIGSPITIGTRPYGINFFGVYKVPISRNWKVFGKAGIHAAFNLSNVYRGYYDFYGYYDYYYYYDDSGPEKNGVGTAFGIGIEHRLTKKLSLLVGGTFKMLFDEGTRYAPEQGNSRWFKMYTALNYRVR